ncbi:hypothetical protein EUGRSUZ_J00132 [Eucalyptus grandis]|uniref:Uncharacterized protein n=2 Tax=Eucalyptus grandis TaxID=71139 RepID=A0ACC3J2D1_EUCGR|nr:hypothetical protein EUGRSUZ_J00132 [Eucalyptus grandis]
MHRGALASSEAPAIEDATCNGIPQFSLDLSQLLSHSTDLGYLFCFESKSLFNETRAYNKSLNESFR